MVKNIFETIKNAERSIFKKEEVFYPQYIPENIPARESQIKELTYLLKPLASNKKTNNILIYGPTGTGKTLITNYVLNELCEYTHNVKHIYINTIQYNTKSGIITQIATLFGEIFPRRGIAIDEIYIRIKEDLGKSDFWPIIVLDEIDKLNKNDASEILYDLTRMENKGKYFTLILITNTKECIINLDQRTQSSLFLREIEFPKYTPQELKEILKERIEYGLIPDAISQDLIGYITGYAASNGGDARIGIDLLYKAAKETEKQGLLKITKETLLSSSKLIDSVKISEKINYLTDLEKQILKTIDQNGTTVSEIYQKLKDTKYDTRTIRRQITNLQNIKLITIKETPGNKKQRIILLNVDKKLLNV